MRKAWVLSKLYINSAYGIKGMIANLKGDKKAALKIIGFIAIILLTILGFAPMLVGFNLMLYNALKPISQQGVMITNAVITASMFTIVFGIVGVIATYYVDKERDIVLSMPIKPWYLLTAKFSVNYLSEILITLLVMLPAVIIYGVKEAQGVLFYLSSLIVIAFIPVIPLVISFFILIPIMKFASFMKKKDTMMILSGLLGIGLAMAIQLFSSSMVKFEKNTQLMAQSFTAPNGLVSVVGKTYYPAIMATKGIINSGSVAGIVNLLLIAGISVLLTILLIYSMSGAYFNSNIGSDEVKKETKKYNESEFKERLRGKTSLMSLLSREIKLMNREPIYLLNGPMIILIMPLMLGMIFLIQKENMTELTSQIDKITSATYYITLAVAGMGMFLGITGTPTSSAISREGKGFMQIKAMPMSPRDYINAKLLHGIIIGALAALMSCALGYFLVSLPLVNCIIAFVISNLIMLPIMIAGLLLDLKWPKLLWDNPVKAMKQNVNVMVVVLGEMFVVLPVLGLLIYFLLREPSYGYLVLIAFPAVASVILYSFLMKFGEKRFYDIEI